MKKLIIAALVLASQASFAGEKDCWSMAHCQPPPPPHEGG